MTQTTSPQQLIELTSLDDPRVAVFSSLTEAQLRHRLNPTQSLFIAESPKVIRVALDAGYQPVSMLCEERHITGDAADIVQRIAPCPVYYGSRSLLTALTGYTLTRGVLCAMRRPTLPSVEAPMPAASWSSRGWSIQLTSVRSSALQRPWASMVYCSPPTPATHSTEEQ